MNSPAESAKSTIRGTASMEKRRQTPNDFIFGRLIGEGSFSHVFLAREIHSSQEFAVKVCDQRHIIKEKKQKYIFSEKKVLVKILANWDPQIPFFVRLHSTFKDASRLYFVMTYAKNGDLFKFIAKLTERAIDCTQFYAAELLMAVEFLHKNGILHRDLKPENILLNENMHILITDFGSAKLLEDTDASERGEDEPMPKRKSFVGSPQYVSPEILTGRGSSNASDLWAIGCILYQMLTGLPPFQSQSEYLIFQKIQKLEYSFHEGFDEKAKDLIRKLLIIEPEERLGTNDSVYYTSIRSHDFFSGVDFETLAGSTPPSITQFVPKENVPDKCWRKSDLRPGVERLNQIILDEGESDDDGTGVSEIERILEQSQGSHSSKAKEAAPLKRNILNISEERREELLEDQRKKNKYHRFVGDNLIIKQGILDKKKGLWARRRIFLLCEGSNELLCNRRSICK